MIIGLPREIKNQENRLALLPEGVRQLTDEGHQVLIEAEFALPLGLSDEEYTLAGASVRPTSADVYLEAELVLKVQEPLEEEFGFLRSGQILFCYLHLAANRHLTSNLLERGVIALAYEMVHTADGALPLLAPVSAVAGCLAPQIGARCLEHHVGGKGILLGGVTGTQPAQVTILGGGIVGMNAARIALGLGAHVAVLDANQHRLDYLAEHLGHRLVTAYAHPEQIERYVQAADLLIGALLVPGAQTPQVVPQEWVDQMRPGGAIIDVSIDQGGVFVHSKPTSHEHPTYIREGIVYYAVPNMTAAVPATTTAALTHATLPYVLEIARHGWHKAIEQDPGLKAGLSTWNGNLSAQAVADCFALPWKPLKT